MLTILEINHQLLINKLQDKNEPIFKNINTNSILFNEKNTTDKRNIPIKQYSNKFLREEHGEDRDAERAHQNRFNNLVKKHKIFQKKFTVPPYRNTFICKTEPNQNQYNIFKTSSAFYKNHCPHTRTRTESMINKNSKNLPQFQSPSQQLKIEPLQNAILKECLSQCENKMKDRTNPQTYNPFKFQEKISTSRALEMYAKIISKDNKGDIVEKMNISNQRKFIKDKILESTKNLEARQVVFFHKSRKMSLTEKGEKGGEKNILKFRKKTHTRTRKLFVQDENFELKGWQDN